MKKTKNKKNWIKPEIRILDINNGAGPPIDFNAGGVLSS
jgi:hypothetical protein